jgi:hypothetical protein
MALIGVLLLGFGNGGVIVAEQWVPSGIAAVLIAMVQGRAVHAPDGDCSRGDPGGMPSHRRFSLFPN